MLRDIKRVRGRVPVLPTMAARPTAPDVPGHPELARRDATPSDGRNATASRSDIPGPTQAPAMDKPATAPRPASDKPVMSVADKPATMAAPTEAPTDTPRARHWLKIVPLAACLVAVAAGWWLRGEVASPVAMTIAPATGTGDDVAPVNQALQQERDKAEKLARELTTAWRELRSQAVALADSAAQRQELTDLRQALQQTERQSEAYRESLAQERAHNRGLDEQPAARRDTTPGRGRNAMASLSDTPVPAPTTDKPATAPLAASGKPVIAAAAVDDKPATITARSTAPEVRVTAPEAPGNPEALRLMARASLLLSQGNIVAARTVLDRAAETGSALALFALAETYDPIILAAWGTFGTQGDAAKARELYARAFAGGVQEANDRLNALR
jgi:hypothetical protein